MQRRIKSLENIPAFPTIFFSASSCEDNGSDVQNRKDAHSVGKIPFTEAHKMRTYASRTFTHLQDAKSLLAKAENAGDAAKVAKYSQRVAALNDVIKTEVKLGQEIIFKLGTGRGSSALNDGVSATRRAARGNIKEISEK